MKKGINYLAIVTILGAAGSWLFGVWDENLKILCILVIVDYLTAFTKGAILGKLSSDTGRKELFKKVLIFLAVFVSHLVDKILFEGASMIMPDNAHLITFDGAGLIRNLAIWFYIAHEAVAIIENLQESGMKIPKRIEKVFKDMNGSLNNK